MSELEAPGACFVCRCEELDEATLRAAIAAGARTINDVKRRSRAGMGLCQGVCCLEHVARLLSETEGLPAPATPMTSRPPARMIALRELAGTAIDQS